jgi:hypothetical protein
LPIIVAAGHRLTKAHKQQISLVRQEDLFFPTLTVREHLAFTALLRFQSPSPAPQKQQQQGGGGTSGNVVETSTTAEGVQRTLASLLQLLSMDEVGGSWLDGGVHRQSPHYTTVQFTGDVFIVST